MTGRRTVGNRDELEGTDDLKGIAFGEEKWQHPYEATAIYPAEHIRTQESARGFGGEGVYGQGNGGNIWSRGILEGLAYYFSPSDTAAHKIATTPSLDEFREQSPPVSWYNTRSVAAAALGFNAALFRRYHMRQPYNSRVHATVFTCAFMYWAGYQWNKQVVMREMGEFKYACDFAERHSDIINRQKPAKYGDPQILEHWKSSNFSVNLS